MSGARALSAAYDELRAVVKDVFALVDADGDGHIEKSEGLIVGSVVEGASHAEQFWKNLLAECDEKHGDKNGTVELDEWTRYVVADCVDGVQAPRVSILRPLGYTGHFTALCS